MSDGSDSGGADPRTPEQSTGDVEKAEEDHVPMEAGALLALVHEDKPEKKCLSQLRVSVFVSFSILYLLY